MDEATAAIIGAALGAGGSVAAQVIASVVTAKRERRRFDWEREQATRQYEAQVAADASRQEEARLQRFADLRRKLFSSVLARLDSCLEDLRRLAWQSDPRSVSGVDLDPYYSVVAGWIDESNAQYGELSLVAPNVYRVAEWVRPVMIETAQALDEAIEQSVKDRVRVLSDSRGAIREATDQLREAMQHDLGTRLPRPH